ncbi:MAG TPA: hypothetical protein VFA03_04390 [Acetobacteraceae bacterium]|nr:hypothetical protein [Acetobacteraceae bacterium]
MAKLAIALAVALALLSGRAFALPACPDGQPYATYMAIGAGGCLLNDKAFSNFTLALGPNSGAATTPKANQITVMPITTAGNPGFRFTGNPPFHAPALPGPPTFFSYRFGYDVRVQAAGQPITDASLTMLAPTLAADGSVSIAEDICLGAVFESKGVCAHNAPMRTLNVFDTPQGVQLTASLTFSQPYRLVATQTLLIASAGLAGSASVDSFTEQFSEAPARALEPGSLEVFGTALALVAAFAAAARGRPRATP